MKKTAFARLSALLLIFALAACGKAAPETASPAVLEATPLIRTATEGAGETRLIPAGDGILALWERDGGFAGAYVSGTKSALTEDLVTGSFAPEDAAFLETEAGKGVLAAGSFAWYLLLDGSGAEETALPDGLVFTGVLYRDEGLVCRKDSLLLLLPADLKDPLVLTDTAAFPDYGGVLSVSPDGRRVWCLAKNGGAGYTGLFAFCPGETRTERALSLAFDGALPAGGERVLLWRQDGDGAVYTLLDLPTEEALTVTVPFRAAALALSGTGDRIALYDPESASVRVWDFAAGRETGSKECAELGEAVALCYGGDGVLYASLRREGGEILVTLK